MKVLIVGGSGHVGSLTVPYLKDKHELRVFDLQTPADTSLEYHPGDVADLPALREAMKGVDAFIYMAMGTLPGRAYDNEEKFIATSFDVNVKGLYHTLRAAHDARVGHGIYASSLSVFLGAPGQRRPGSRFFAHEQMVPDALGCYGLTKRLGEEVCRSATLQWGLRINALRLCRPVSPDDYQKYARIERVGIVTSAPDVANALDAALKYRPAGFEAFFISGDYNEQLMSLEKAKLLLDWEPLARPTKSTADDARNE